MIRRVRALTTLPFFLIAIILFITFIKLTQFVNPFFIKIGIIFILFPCLGLGQYVSNFTINDGLPSNHVYKVTQDAKGFIWFITDNGIVKYNGSQFKVFTTKEGLPTNDVWEIATTPDGKVWFFCKASRIGYIENDTVISFSGTDPKEVFFPLRILEFKNEVLFENKGDWYFLNTEKKWQGINTLKSHPLKKIQSKINGIINDAQEDYVIHFKMKDSLLFWVTQNNYFVLNAKTNRLVDGQKDFGFKKEFSRFARINYINNQIQITDSHFVAVLDDHYKIKFSKEILKDFNTHHTIVDKTGNLWSTSFQNGVFKTPSIYQKIDSYFPSEKIESIQKFGDKLVINVYDKGFFSFEKDTRKFTQLIKEKGTLYPLSRVDDFQKFYYIHQFEVSSFSYGNLKLIKRKNISEGNKQFVFKDGFMYGLGSYEIKKMDPIDLEVTNRYPAVGMNKLLITNDHFFVACTDGLKYFDGTRVIPFENDTLFSKPVQNIVTLDKDWIIVGTEGYGAYATNMKETTYFPQSQFLSVKDAFVKGNTIWLATNDGLYEYEKKENAFQFVKNFTQEIGLSTRKVNSVFMEDNVLYMGTDNGLVVFPNTIKPQNQFLDIYFDAIQYNSNEIGEVQEQLLYTNNNSLRVRIGDINYSERKEAITYRYKLSPFQEEWHDTYSTTLNFSNLQPNNYTLQIASGSHQKSYSFTILPLWWQKTTTKVIALILLLSFLALLLQSIRKRELKKKTAKLNAQKKMAEYELYALRSQMNPHFVFNSLSAIQYYINENDFENSEKYLVKFSKLVRQFFDISKEEEITLDNEILLLTHYLEIEKLRFKEKLDFEIHVDPKLPTGTTKIPTMLLQPVVENAVNHGIFNKETSGKVTLQFTFVDASTFAVTILDDGVGQERTKKEKAHKISSSIILKDRIAILNESQKWDIRFSSENAFSEAFDKGNKVVFVIKNLL